MTKTEKPQNQQKRLLLPALAAVCVLTLAVMVYVLIVTGRTRNGQAENGQTAFVPPPFEAEAIKGTPKEESGISDGDSGNSADIRRQQERLQRLEQLGYSNLDAVEYQVSVCGAPVIEDGKAVLYLTNPETNQVWIKVRLLDASGRMLGESGLLRAGEYVETVILDMEAVKAARDAEEISVKAANSAERAGIPVSLRIMAYEPETYHSAGAVSLNTTLTWGETEL